MAQFNLVVDVVIVTSTCYFLAAFRHCTGVSFVWCGGVSCHGKLCGSRSIKNSRKIRAIVMNPFGARSQGSVLILVLFTYSYSLVHSSRPTATIRVHGCGCRNTSTSSSASTSVDIDSSSGGEAPMPLSPPQEVECKCDGPRLTDLASDLPSPLTRITVTATESFTRLSPEQLSPYNETLAEIVLHDLPEFRTIEDDTFEGLENLTTIYIHDTPALVRVSEHAFRGYLPKLKIIKIHHTSLVEVPDFSQLQLQPSQLLHMLDLENNHITTIKPGWIKNIKVDYLGLSHNRIEEIGPRAFQGATIARLALNGNRQLRTLHPEAFVDIEYLQQLDLSETSITQLPTLGLRMIESLRLENVYSLTTIPSIYHFPDLRDASLTYPYHCCAFHSPEQHDPIAYSRYQEFLGKVKEMCPPDEVGVITHRRRRESEAGLETVVTANWTNTTASSFYPFVFDPDTGSGIGIAPTVGLDLNSFNSEVEDDFGFGTFHESLPGPPPDQIKLCGNVTLQALPVVRCIPMPDAFSPCEDIMGTIWLRASVWIVVALALVGNTAVLLVLIMAPGRMSVQRFLMANLSLADLSMGLYLLLVASEDLISLGTYFNYAIRWQQGWGCQLAGFLTVFASELSVYTLAIITGERWYALTRAIHLTRRLTIVGAAGLMAAGWVLSLVLAILPLVGVSSYSRTSICLPMDGSTPAAQGYLVFLLLFNGLAFSLVALAYWQMYSAVATHGSAREGSNAHTASDAAVAKKMALLVFTDFACWAPVAFFGLTAVAGLPLIGVTDSKILLVFFYPLNACCNPYLYAILTKQYRRDLLLLLSRYGMCPKRAARFKTGLTSGHSGHTMQTVVRVGGGGSITTGTTVETRLVGLGRPAPPGGRISQSSLAGSYAHSHSHGRSDEAIFSPSVQTFSLMPSGTSGGEGGGGSPVTTKAKVTGLLSGSQPSTNSNSNGNGNGTFHYSRIPTEDRDLT